MTNKSYAAVMVALVLGTSTPVMAEWSSNPATAPLIVTDNGNAPKLVPDQDGGTYITFRNNLYTPFNAENSGFDIFALHYDAFGNQSWDAPIRMFDTSKSYVSYYGAVIDGDGNLYIGNDIYPANIPSDHSTVQINKVNKDGTLGWETPVVVSHDEGLYSNGLGLTMAAKGDHIAAVWAKGFTGQTVDTFTGMACIDKSGKILWQRDIQIDNKYTFATKPVVTDDGVIVLLEVGIAPGTSNSLFMMQKYSLVDGSEMWPQPINITSGNSFFHPVNNGLSTQLIADNESGVILTNYHVLSPNEGTLFLQHVHADGSKQFAGQGLRISGNELGNSVTSLSYDGGNYYMVWAANKIAPNDDGVATKFSAIKGTAIDGNGRFIWNQNGSTEPTFLKPWRPFLTSGPIANWFSGYMEPRTVLNENGNLNMTWGEETTYRYNLKAQPIDVKTGVPIGEAVMHSNGPVQATGDMAHARTVFGQPLLAYVENGPIKLVNFDADAKSGVSENVLVEKPAPITLKPGEEKTLTLKVLDNHSNNHNSSLSEATGSVNATVADNDNAVKVTLSTDAWLEDADMVTVNVQDVDNVDRIGTSAIKIHAPRYHAPSIVPMETLTIAEHESVAFSAQIDAAEYAVLDITWQQMSGPAVEFVADGASLSVMTDYVEKDTALTFNLSVTDGKQIASQNVTINVQNTSQPSISAGNAQAKPGEQFSLTPVISGAKAPVSYTWSQRDGARTVYTFDDKGVLSGTAPLTEGTVVLSLQATDANGESFSQDFNVAVALPVEENNNNDGGSLGFSVLLLGLLSVCKRAFGKIQNKN